MKKKSRREKIFSKIRWIIFKIVLILFCFTIFQVLALKYIHPPFTPNVAWEWMESIRKKHPSKHLTYEWKKMDSISLYLQKAVIAAEDQRFFYHHGFDYKEIMNAVTAFIHGEKLRGASTISMQTARSVFLLSSKSVFRKIAEAYYTVLIELFWDKQRILEMYLNTVDWGTGVTGAEAACQKYYSISAKELTAEQAAILTAILPNPHIWSVKNPTPYLQARQEKILKSLHKIPLL